MEAVDSETQSPPFSSSSGSSYSFPHQDIHLNSVQETFNVVSSNKYVNKNIEGTESGLDLKEKKGFYYHRSSIIDTNSNIGKNTKVWHFSHVSSGSIIGENCILGQNTFIGNLIWYLNIHSINGGLK